MQLCGNCEMKTASDVHHTSDENSAGKGNLFYFYVRPTSVDSVRCSRISVHSLPLLFTKIKLLCVKVFEVDSRKRDKNKKASVWHGVNIQTQSRGWLRQETGEVCFNFCLTFSCGSFEIELVKAGCHPLGPFPSSTLLYQKQSLDRKFKRVSCFFFVRTFNGANIGYFEHYFLIAMSINTHIKINLH